jgi:hypothetical protein
MLPRRDRRGTAPNRKNTCRRSRLSTPPSLPSVHASGCRCACADQALCSIVSLDDFCSAQCTQFYGQLLRQLEAWERREHTNADTPADDHSQQHVQHILHMRLDGSGLCTRPAHATLILTVFRCGRYPMGHTHPLEATRTLVGLPFVSINQSIFYLISPPICCSLPRATCMQALRV